MLVGDGSLVLAVLHAMTGWWAPLPLLWLALAAGLRWWPHAGASAPLVALWLAWTVPGTLGTAPGGEADLRLVSANLHMVHPDPAALGAELFSHDADVLLLQEVSPRWVPVLQQQFGDYPHHHVIAQGDSFGQAILSRHPLTQLVVHDFDGVALIDASIEVQGHTVRLMDVHTLPPRTAEYAAWWQGQMARLPTMLDDRTTVIAGDLNATRHHPSYRRLLRDGGLRDAHTEVGRAAAWTWPNGLFPAPPLRLDHVLVSTGIQVLDVREGPAVGSDHKPLIVELKLD